jgi:hypothetical protein
MMIVKHAKIFIKLKFWISWISYNWYWTSVAAINIYVLAYVCDAKFKEYYVVRIP